MHVIIANFGNDSVALIEWAHQQQLRDVFVLWVDTGWAAPEWSQRVEKANQMLVHYHFTSVCLKPEYNFSELVRERNNFPSNKFHWCASFLKGLPIVDWLDAQDLNLQASVLLAKRREQAPALRNLTEFEEESHSYGGRRVWHPLYQHTLIQRNQLIQQSGFDLLSTRSLECDPCIYNQQSDFVRLVPNTIAQVAALEEEIKKPMFFDKIQVVVKKANQEADLFSHADLSCDKTVYYQGCGSEFGCGD